MGFEKDTLRNKIALVIGGSGESGPKVCEVLAKACVNQMTPFLASAFAPAVRVITLVPGLIDIEETEPDLRRQRAEQSPLKRNMAPEEIGLMVVAAATEAFRSVSGVSIFMDGGFWLLHR